MVLSNGKQIKVRLQGIDSPELGQGFGTPAKQFTSSLAFGQTVTLRDKGRDRNGRLLAEVMLPDGRSLNRELVRGGFAWWFRKYSSDQDLARGWRERHGGGSGPIRSQLRHGIIGAQRVRRSISFREC
jgi:endonuclease YncB( thermonuclease family)